MMSLERLLTKIFVVITNSCLKIIVIVEVEVFLLIDIFDAGFVFPNKPVFQLVNEF